MSKTNYNIEDTYLEQVWKSESEYSPIYVIDFQVFCHSLFNYIESSLQLELYQDKIDDIIKALWAVKLNRGPDMLPQMDFTAIIVDDCKGQVEDGASSTSEGYWRHIVAKEYGLQEYKIGRKNKPALFYKVRDIGLEYIFSENSPFYYFKQMYMEADDLAGKLSRIKRNAEPNSVASQREMFLGTVDGDWQGLVDDQNKILWANTGPWMPRLRDEQAVCDYYLRKNKYKITKARECYDVKAVCGDAGDGLKPGSPLRLFNLYEEDSEYNFSEDVTQDMLKALNDEKPSNNLRHLKTASSFLLSFGIMPPISGEVDPLDIQKALERAKVERDKALKVEAVGRLKKVCQPLEEVDQEIFEKCAKISLEDKDSQYNIKEAEVSLAKCPPKDLSCISFYKNIIKNLKEIRKKLKEAALNLTKIRF